jgi:Family of unknown function (DUF6636)
MTENPHDLRRARATRAIGWWGLVLPVAVAAVTVAGCSSSAGSTHATSNNPAPSPVSAPTVTVTVTPAPEPAPVTVTVAPEPAPATATVVQPASNGPASFRSPSGNINCSLSAPGGDIAARCEVVNHAWAAPPLEPECHLNWGDRFELTQGNNAAFDCYGQEFPAVNETLAYGQARSLGTITCDSEYTGMTCTDCSTGHYFRISRDTYELG